MKIFNLNEYSEEDGLKNKLSKRIDQFEPELSDSLWDRIHHEMDQREANRKKRILWWFSSVAVVVLTSGIVTFTLVNSTEQPLALQQPVATQQAPVVNKNTTSNAATTQIPENSNTSTVNSSTETNAVVSSVTPTTKGSSSNNNTSKNKGNGGSVATQTTPSTPVQQPNNVLPAADKVTPSTETTTEIVEPAITVTEQQNPEPKETILAQEDTEPLVATAKNDVKNTKATPSLTETKTNRQKWFIGMVYGYNQTYRTVSDVNKVIGLPSASQKSNYESKSYSPTYGIEFGFSPIKNFFIKSGVGVYKTSETVEYSIYKRQHLIGGPQGGNPKDSVGVGNNITKQNNYTYIQIPLEVGYTTNIYKNIGVYVSAGMTYNVINSYNYNYYEAYYGNTMSNVNNNNSNYFTNYIQLGGSAGAQYTIAKHWRVSAGFTYRKAITSSSSVKETGVSTKPWSAGATAGLAFIF